MEHKTAMSLFRMEVRPVTAEHKHLGSPGRSTQREFAAGTLDNVSTHVLTIA
jgi:hypothetical protein